jgi:hypothetical protein
MRSTAARHFVGGAGGLPLLYTMETAFSLRVSAAWIPFYSLAAPPLRPWRCAGPLERVLAILARNR